MRAEGRSHDEIWGHILNMIKKWTNLQLLIDTFQPVNGGVESSDISLTHLELLLKIRDLAQMGLPLCRILRFELILK